MLKFQDLRTIRAVKIWYNKIHNTCPKYITKILTPSNVKHEYNTRHNAQTARDRLTKTETTIKFTIPRIIESLRINVKSKFTTHSSRGVINYCKNFLIENYQPNCQIDNCYICSSR